MIVDTALYEHGHRVAENLDLAAMVARGRDPDAFVWLGLFEPDDAELEEVAETFDLHPLAVEDALHAHQRPKLERYGDSIFVVMKTVGLEDGDGDDDLDIGEIMLFVGEGFVVSVRHGSFTGLAEVRSMLEEEPERLAEGVGAVLHAVADRVVDAYEERLDDLDREVEELEREVFTPGHHDLAARLYHAKRDVQTIRRAIAPFGDVTVQLVGDPPPLHVQPALQPYLRDVHDHVVRASDRLSLLAELLDDALSTNVAQIGLRQNEDMRKISAWVGIVAVPTMIAGIYGMNFAYMPELEWRYGYFVVLAVIGLAATGLYRLFKRSGWL